jgi:hypothetical protein
MTLDPKVKTTWHPIGRGQGAGGDIDVSDV